ncbi:hypothetical protein GGX14DRAFT_610916 [Mycena pura]|uniref:DUF6533 domain-containing protein n=1 Tax=Mycena pura TaxID=153505 RepID=A0AAD6VJ69_9AGAR|nr:hypothetical protein GGX14DRAFT_610916 [Mycena pura]
MVKYRWCSSVWFHVETGLLARGSAWRTSDMDTTELEKSPNSVGYRPHGQRSGTADVHAALLFYDYFLTLEWEVSRYWQRGISWPTVFFFANRYGTLLGNVPVVFLDFWTAPASATKGQCFIIVIQIIIGVMLIVRTYALYERNNRVLAFMLAFSVGIICIGIVSTLYSDRPSGGDQGSVLPLDIGCGFTVSQAESKSLIVAWSGLGLFDCMIFLLTLYKTLSRIRPKGLNVLTVFMRDGATLPASPPAGIVLKTLPFFYPQLGGPNTRGLFNTTTNVISSVMLSRLMLNIRDPALREQAAMHRTPPRAIEPLRNASVPTSLRNGHSAPPQMYITTLRHSISRPIPVGNLRAAPHEISETYTHPSESSRPLRSTVSDSELVSTAALSFETIKMAGRSQAYAGDSCHPLTAKLSTAGAVKTMVFVLLPASTLKLDYSFTPVPALLFYDYFLTLEWEVSRYWRRGITSPSVLFFANRYGTLLGNIPIILLSFWNSPASPSKGQVEFLVDLIPPQHSFGTPASTVMLILRTYALYERNNRILAFMLAFATGVICIGVWSTIYSDHNLAADQKSVLPLDIGSKGLIIAWSALGLFDCVIFVLTLYKTLSRRRPEGLNLLTVLMRDAWHCVIDRNTRPLQHDHERNIVADDLPAHVEYPRPGTGSGHELRFARDDREASRRVFNVSGIDAFSEECGS